MVCISYRKCLCDRWEPSGFLNHSAFSSFKIDELWWPLSQKRSRIRPKFPLTIDRKPMGVYWKQNSDLTPSDLEPRYKGSYFRPSLLCHLLVDFSQIIFWRRPVSTTPANSIMIGWKLMPQSTLCKTVTRIVVKSRCRKEKVDREKSRHRRYCACAAPPTRVRVRVLVMVVCSMGRAARVQ